MPFKAERRGRSTLTSSILLCSFQPPANLPLAKPNCSQWTAPPGKHRLPGGPLWLKAEKGKWIRVKTGKWLARMARKGKQKWISRTLNQIGLPCSGAIHQTISGQMTDHSNFHSLGFPQPLQRVIWCNGKKTVLGGDSFGVSAFTRGRVEGERKFLVFFPLFSPNQ